jgi:hypothetical protein
MDCALRLLLLGCLKQGKLFSECHFCGCMRTCVSSLLIPSTLKCKASKEIGWHTECSDILSLVKLRCGENKVQVPSYKFLPCLQKSSVRDKAMSMDKVHGIECRSTSIIKDKRAPITRSDSPVLPTHLTSLQVTTLCLLSSPKHHFSEMIPRNLRRHLGQDGSTVHHPLCVWHLLGGYF